MLHNFSQYVNLINEGSSNNHTILYWKSQFEDVINKDWYDIKTDRIGDKYSIKFRISDKDEKYNYFSVILENKNGKESFYVENDDSKIFVEKFKKEFWNNPQEYIKNMKYHPKCLGDLSPVTTAGKFNM